MFENWRWTNRFLLVHALLGVAIIIAFVIAIAADKASQPDGCIECAFPVGAYTASAVWIAGIQLIWFPLVFWAGTLDTPGNARLFASVQLVGAAVFGTVVVWFAGAMVPFWAASLDLMWIGLGAAHGLAVWLKPWQSLGPQP